MRIGFITCVRLGESCLEELAALGANLVYLGTIHDGIARNKSGRIYLDDFAEAHHVPLHKFRNMNDPDSLEVIEASDLDWLYVIGWSQMAKAEVLSIPRRGVLGIHPTLLPQGRGRASIPWAIIKGLDETGVTMFKLDDGMDTGPSSVRSSYPLKPTRRRPPCTRRWSRHTARSSEPPFRVSPTARSNWSLRTKPRRRSGPAANPAMAD